MLETHAPNTHQPEIPIFERPEDLFFSKRSGFLASAQQAFPLNRSRPVFSMTGSRKRGLPLESRSEQVAI